MKWEDLQKQALRIVKNTPQGVFEDKTFSTGSGRVEIEEGIPVLHQSSEFAYSTTANGDAHRCTVTIRCRCTGFRDSKGREVFETQDGRVFVWVYHPGNAHYFDGGRIASPVMQAAAVG